jgi:hypothetical protein
MSVVHRATCHIWPMESPARQREDRSHVIDCSNCLLVFLHPDPLGSVGFPVPSGWSAAQTWPMRFEKRHDIVLSELRLLRSIARDCQPINGSELECRQFASQAERERELTDLIKLLFRDTEGVVQRAATYTIYTRQQTTHNTQQTTHNTCIGFATRYGAKSNNQT